MRLLTQVSIALSCAALAMLPAEEQLKIQPIKTSIKLDQEQVEITLWGTLSPQPTGTFALALTVDLGDFQEHLTPVLSAQLKRDDRCGDRLSVERATIVPSPPSSLLTAN